MSVRTISKHSLIVLLMVALTLLFFAGCSIWDRVQPDESVSREVDDPFETEEDITEQPSFPEQDEPEEGAADPESESEPDTNPNELEEGERQLPADDSPQKDRLKLIADGDYFLALVTKETTLKSDYRPSNLQAIPAYMNPSYDMQLRGLALDKLKDLWQAAEANGVLLSIRSAYRSYSTQERLFQDYASRYGEKEANRFSARPGQSEHQLGTTVDFGGTGVDFSAAYANTPQGKWLAENAHRFGFAMSYPAGKEDVTGYIFEPWHYRFVGIEEAREWKETGLTLREYLETRPQQFE